MSFVQLVNLWFSTFVFDFESLILLSITVFSILFLGVSPSFANVCSALQSQLHSIGRGTESRANPAVAQLRRQLAAIQGLERQRRCSSKRAARVFFDACLDLASRRAAVQSQIGSAANSGGGASAIRARLAALGCAPEGAKRGQAKRAEASDGIGGNAVLFCVRLSDGYFFPTPNSQFASGGDLKTTLDQCRYICETPNVDVYTLADVSLETEEMVSVEERKAYKDLATAFRYREDASFRGCDLKRYYRHVDEFRARSVTPHNLANAIIPLPTARPEPRIVAKASRIDNPPEDAAPSGSAASAAATRRVRVVGPAFFPSE